jgi:hypothetical protein
MKPVATRIGVAAGFCFWVRAWRGLFGVGAVFLGVPNQADAGGGVVRGGIACGDGYGGAVGGVEDVVRGADVFVAGLILEMRLVPGDDGVFGIGGFDYDRTVADAFALGDVRGIEGDRDIADGFGFILSDERHGYGKNQRESCDGEKIFEQAGTSGVVMRWYLVWMDRSRFCEMLKAIRRTMWVVM